MADDSILLNKVQQTSEQRFEPVKIPYWVGNDLFILTQQDVRNVIETRYIFYKKCDPNTGFPCAASRNLEVPIPKVAADCIATNEGLAKLSLLLQNSMTVWEAIAKLNNVGCLNTGEDRRLHSSSGSPVQQLMDLDKINDNDQFMEELGNQRRVKFVDSNDLLRSRIKNFAHNFTSPLKKCFSRGTLKNNSEEDEKLSEKISAYEKIKNQKMINDAMNN